ncbi:MAG: c-type cytochrome [Spirulinaceae cyanobacterium SM2_1_0]|nr:c-type cytochrome [Spirulinaceae cyanobacterium SM2_1_0]
MNNSSVQPQTIWQRFAVIAAFVLLLVGAVLAGVYWFKSSDPYIQEVLSLPGDPQQGQAIYTINCAGCHGSEANGNVGPGLHNVSHHKSPTALIQQVTSGKTPPMPQFQPRPQAMADLLSYLEQL